MKRILMTLLAFSLFTTHTFAVTQNGMKNAIDEYVYSVQVDGLDQAAAEAVLKTRLQTLLAEGMTQKELLDAAQSQIKDQALAKDLKTVLNIIEVKNLSSADAVEMVNKTIHAHSSKGASWNGDTQMWLWVGAFLVLMIVLSATSSDPLCPDEPYIDGERNECEPNGTNTNEDNWWL